MTHPQVLPEDEYQGHVADDQWEQLKLEVVSLYAGPGAERRFRGRNNHVGARDDMANIDELIPQLAPPRAEFPLRRYLRALAEDLVEKEWNSITRLATVLVERRAMSEQEIRQVLDPPVPDPVASARELVERSGTPRERQRRPRGGL